MVGSLIGKVRRHGFRHSLTTGLMKIGLLPQQSWQGITPVFIVSTGRTGTRYLAHLFAKVPEVFSYHEPHPDLLHLGLDFARNKVSEKKAVEIIEQQRRALCVATRRNKASFYVESNNRLFSLLKPLRKTFPNCKIIHVVRQGQDYVRSGLARPWFTEGDTAHRLRADWFPEDPYFDKWPEMTRFQKIAWLWQKKDSFINEDCEALPDTLKVTFDEIFNEEGRPGLYKVANYIGLSHQQVDQALVAMGDNVPNKTPAAHRAESPLDWSPEMVEQFNQVAGHYHRLHFS